MKVESQMLMADAKNMLGDVFLSGSVLIGLIFTFILKLPIMDQVMGRPGLSLDHADRLRYFLRIHGRADGGNPG